MLVLLGSTVWIAAFPVRWVTGMVVLWRHAYWRFECLRWGVVFVGLLSTWFSRFPSVPLGGLRPDSSAWCSISMGVAWPAWNVVVLTAVFVVGLYGGSVVAAAFHMLD